MDTIRDAPFGQLLRWLTGNRVFLYPEERPDFVLPESLANLDTKLPDDPVPSEKPAEARTDAGVDSEVEAKGINPSEADAARVNSHEDPGTGDTELLELDEDVEAGSQTTQNAPVQPQRTNDGHILVDWYSEDDPANPQNWSLTKKTFVTLHIW